MLKPSTLLLKAGGLVWCLLVLLGLQVLWRYEGTPGPPAAPPPRWPHQSGLVPGAAQPTLLILAHPRCPCTRATLGELAILMDRLRGRLRAHLLFYAPGDSPAGWERTDLWDQAAAIPGVSLHRDDEGAEARRFGAVTSGQALLYDAAGRLRFQGGITAARGHAGDNPGRAALLELVEKGAAARERAHVFGCAILGS